ncbi:hypothetical protein KFE25_010707 [Diacronema lutheri]|uniref:Uncharacterized protein n=1 Tax=Diacronema lutheri TaxID=2081491 RepID=A0A8J6C7F1_DIALT|nr:hypothetical protein KFE25_010707 [Diacronema lutheri]
MRSFATKRARATSDEWALALVNSAPPRSVALLPAVAQPSPDTNDDVGADDGAARAALASAVAWGALLGGRAMESGAPPTHRARVSATVRPGARDTPPRRQQQQLRLVPHRHDGHGAIRVCAQCGLLYARGNPADEAAHARHHKAHVRPSIVFRPDAHEDVVERGSTADHEPWRIVRLAAARASRTARGRLARVSEVLERELGCEPLGDARAAPAVAFALVGFGHRLRGLVVAEPIDGGWELDLEEPLGAEGGTPAARARAASAGDAARAGSLRSSSVGVPAECGVRYIWVERGRRRAGIARALVEAARAHLLAGRCVPRERVAFSQPTEDGHAFARRYTGTARFAVYVPTSPSAESGHGGG